MSRIPIVKAFRDKVTRKKKQYLNFHLYLGIVHKLHNLWWEVGLKLPNFEYEKLRREGGTRRQSRPNLHIF